MMHEVFRFLAYFDFCHGQFANVLRIALFRSRNLAACKQI